MTHKVTHAIMFHHFHNHIHEPAQGSLNENEFRKMIIWLSKRYTILNANEYQSKFELNTLSENEICFSFDDALKCQYDVAVPVMKDLGINAFFFVYSNIFSNNPDYLEIFRLFRTTCFKNIYDFYDKFFNLVNQKNPNLYMKQKLVFKKIKYLSDFPFYSCDDKWFRYLRDQFLSKKEYKEIMMYLMNQKKFNIENAKKNLWMSENDLIKIQELGHVLGLHSYSHPTKISELTKSEQASEFKRNYDHLSKIATNTIKVMSHPCGDYNKDTLNILESMNISIGFRSNMSIKKINSKFEIPREDHSNIFREMNI